MFRFRSLSAAAALSFAATLSLSSGLPSLALADAKEDVDKFLAGIPATTPAAERETCTAFLALGGESLTQLCGRLSAAGDGDDSKVRFALDGLTSHVASSGGRSAYVSGLLASLARHAAPDAKAFVISQIERLGGDDCVDALSAYLNDARLGDDATRALVVIGTPAAERRLLGVLSTVKDRQKAAIVRALGERRSAQATSSIASLANDDNAELRYAAWQALAKIGDYEAMPFGALEAASKSESRRDRAEANSAYIEYASSVARAGKPDAAADLLRKLIRTRTRADERNVPCAALSHLVDVLGDKALGDLLSAMDSENGDLRAVAVRLAAGIPGADATRAWTEKLGDVDAPAKVKIIGMLGRRGDESAIEAVEREIDSDDASVQIAAIRSASKLQRKSPVPTLLTAIEGGDDAQRARLLSLCSRIGGRGPLEAVAEHVGHSNADIDRVAFTALTSWPEPNAAPHLLAVAKNTKDAGRRGAAIQNYMRLVRAARYPRERMLEIYRDALAASRTSSDKRLVIDGLEALKMVESLEILAALHADEALRDRAATAAVRCALPRKSGKGGLEGERTIEILTKVLSDVKDEGVRKAGTERLEALRKS